MAVRIRLSPPGCSYEKRFGFRPDTPTEEDILECYMQKHFPFGFFVVECVLMPVLPPKKMSGVWFEYSVYGPVDTVDSGEKLFQKLQKKGERYRSLAFNNGKRHYPDAAELGNR